MNRETSSRTDGAQTYQRILDAAGKLFSAQGFAATTNKAVAAEAQVDLASINYHFGSRAGLLQHTLKQAHSRLIDLDALVALDEQPLDAEEKLKRLIMMLVKAIRSDTSWHAPLLARELMSPGPNLQQLFEREALPKFTYIRKIISDVTGIPEDCPEVIACCLSVFTPCLMMFVFGSKMPGPLQQVHHMQAQELANHLYCFSLAGLKAAGERFHNQD